jgi:hypothetical protein
MTIAQVVVAQTSKDSQTGMSENLMDISRCHRNTRMAIRGIARTNISSASQSAV